MMRLNAHLTFNGQCEAAFQFYEEWRDKIFHATFAWGDHFLTGGYAELVLHHAETRRPEGFLDRHLYRTRF